MNMSNDLLGRIEALDKGLLSVEEQRDLAAALGTARDARSEAALLSLLGNEEAIVRYNAIIALGFDRGIRSAAPILKKIATSDPDEDCRDAAVSVLGNIFQNTKDREVLSILGSLALSDADEIIRRSAYKAALIVYGVSREEHLSLLQDKTLVVDTEKVGMMLAN